ncbi:MAG: endonuclease [Bacteroidaceae bacterium]|nr:endonuclease [Bacteroidaceae bacterium]
MRPIFLFVLALMPLFATAQPRFRVMTWNVENLFDCRHDSLKQDEEFLPESERQWTWGRYWRKVEDVSRVIMGLGGDAAPALVALQEIENDSVMITLSRRGSLRAMGYEYVMTNSADRRGVDVALMYLPVLFRLVGSESMRVPSEENGLRPTRDLLHVWGLMPTGDTLHVVVCHLPSRAGGSKENRRNRQLAVETMRRLVDSLLTGHEERKLVVMGDFNTSLRDKALKPLKEHLYPLTPVERRPKSGTYRFQGNWSWLDHIMVGPSLRAEGIEARLYTQPWMQRPMSDGSWYPRRTYLGTRYAGGVSDHVPIYCDLLY